MNVEEFDTNISAERGTSEPAMIVDVEGFEGPLDLLLALARTQKVDLAKISILALADQYLTFIEAAQMAPGVPILARHRYHYAVINAPRGMKDSTTPGRDARQ